jgi:hypothetical protein
MMLNDWPKEVPHIFFVWCFITFLLALTTLILWGISAKEIIRKDIKRYLKS